MQIDRSQILLTSEEESELTAFITQTFLKAKGLTRYDIWQRCFDSYNQKFRRNLSKTESWQRGIRVYMPIMRQLVSTMKSALVQFMFPTDDNYISVEASPQVGEFWSEAVLYNFSRTSWIQNSQKALGQAAITGDNWTAVFPSKENPAFVTAPSLSVFDMVVTPLSEDLTETTKIMVLKMPLWKLIQSPFAYFNLDKLKENKIYNTEFAQFSANQSSMNPGDRGLDDPLGEGYRLYQAYIHHYEFKTTKRELKNFIATMSVQPNILIRFEPQESGYDPFIKTPWEQVDSPSIFWGTGVIEPSLTINGYINTMMTMDLVETMLSAMGIYVYNIDDKTTHAQVLAGNWQVGPAQIWGHGQSGPPQVLQRAHRTGPIRELFYLMKQELIDMVGAQPLFSGSQTVGAQNVTATLTSSQNQGASAKAVRIAMHWDEAYTKPVVYRVIKNIQKTFFTQQGQVIDPYTGQPAIQAGVNFEVIRDWLNAVGMDPNLIEDTAFIQEILEPIDLNQIKVTGSQTLNNKIQAQQNLNSSIEILAKTPASQYIMWDIVAKRVLETYGMKNIDELVVDSQQVIQQLQQQLQTLQQVLTSGINPQTGQPLSPEEYQQAQQQFQALSDQLIVRAGNQQPPPPIEQIAAPQILPQEASGQIGPTEREQIPV